MAYNSKENQRVSVDLPNKVFQRVQKMATESDRSIAAMLRVLILNALHSQEEVKP